MNALLLAGCLLGIYVIAALLVVGGVLAFMYVKKSNSGIPEPDSGPTH